jgi:hypothetical protein
MISQKNGPSLGRGVSPWVSRRGIVFLASSFVNEPGPLGSGALVCRAQERITSPVVSEIDQTDLRFQQEKRKPAGSTRDAFLVLRLRAHSRQLARDSRYGSRTCRSCLDTRRDYCSGAVPIVALHPAARFIAVTMFRTSFITGLSLVIFPASSPGFTTAMLMTFNFVGSFPWYINVTLSNVVSMNSLPSKVTVSFL